MREIRNWGAVRISRIRNAVAEFNKFNRHLLRLRKAILPFRISHVTGPKRLTCDLNGIILICVMRNGIMHIDSFLKHYRRLGIKHFVFLDNYSTDGSLSRLFGEEQVSVLQTSAPYSRYENLMKLFLAERFCRGNWCLCADIDELFDFPYSRYLSLDQFISYLTRENYNAVITQMLDMFSDEPFSQLRSNPEDNLVEKYRYYDISSLTKNTYKHSDVPDGRIMHHTGGIRNQLFRTNNGLTKVSLFLMDGQLEPFVHWHHAKNARIADVSCVLLHFPFVQSFYDKVREAVISGRYGFFVNDEYKAYLEGLNSAPNRSFRLSTAELFTDVEKLVTKGFLVVSEKYVKWANSAGKSVTSKNSATNFATEWPVD